MMGWLGRPGAGRRRVTTLGAEHRAQVVGRHLASIGLVGPTSAAATRIATAPPGYLLVHGSSDVARHCALLSPLPEPDEARVAVTPGRARGEWNLEVASRDRPGLLAAFTGVLASSGIDVAQSVVATWDDGGALEAFVVRSADPPDSHGLQRLFEASLEQPLSSPAVADASLIFDNEASALYTSCEVRAADRRGLLHAVAVAIATAGADVHAARVTTIDGAACDRFDLSDRTGHKLDVASEDAIRTAVLCGVADLRFPRRQRPARRGKATQRASRN